jgi:hypothetical protein
MCKMGKAVTIEQTGKRWKGLALLSYAMIGLGVAVAMTGSFGGGVFVGLLGLAGTMVARIGAWWDNG